MAQQTAVEWLIDRLLFAGYGLPSEWKEQAKAMEKEQIIDAYSFGYTNGFDDAILPDKKVINDAEQYYSETFNK